MLVTRDGIVKLADFGASKAYRDTARTDAMKSMRGSVFWMAPEVIKGTGYGTHAKHTGLLGAATAMLVLSMAWTGWRCHQALQAGHAEAFNGRLPGPYASRWP